VFQSYRCHDNSKREEESFGAVHWTLCPPLIGCHFFLVSSVDHRFFLPFSPSDCFPPVSSSSLSVPLFSSLLLSPSFADFHRLGRKFGCEEWTTSLLSSSSSSLASSSSIGQEQEDFAGSASFSALLSTLWQDMCMGFTWSDGAVEVSCGWRVCRC